MMGLPPEAVCWQQETLMWGRFDAWMNVLARLQGMNSDVLPPLEIVTPRQQNEPARKRSSPQEIAQFFRQMGQNTINPSGDN